MFVCKSLLKYNVILTLTAIPDKRSIIWKDNPTMVYMYRVCTYGHIRILLITKIYNDIVSLVLHCIVQVYHNSN